MTTRLGNAVDDIELGSAMNTLLDDLPPGQQVRIILGRKTGQWAVKMSGMTGTGTSLVGAVRDLVAKRSRR